MINHTQLDEDWLWTTLGYTADDLVICESPDGWSLHAPGSTDEEIATGEAEALADGPWPDGDREGTPTDADYDAAIRELRRRTASRRS